ncbi:aspartate aminotransferase family protein [Paenibacillus sp. TH7-28]
MKKKDRLMMREKMKSSYEFADRGKKVLLSHYTTGFFDEFLFFDHGKGSKIYDPDGNEYLDFSMALGPLIHGHANPAIEEAVIRAVQKGTLHGLGHLDEIRYAEMMTEALGSVDMITFTNSGTEATMFALKCARAYTGKLKIAKFEGHYHGTHDYAQISGRTSTAGTLEAPESVTEYGGIPKETVDQVITLSFNHPSAIDTIRRHKDELAAVIVEPIPLFCPIDATDFLHKLREVTAECGVVLIFDEVVTGFRFCYGGMKEFLNIEADISTYGKIIAGGLPVGAVGGKREFISLFRFDNEHETNRKRISSTGTFSGNPITCAAGIANLEQLKQDPGIYQRMERQARWIKQEVEDYADLVGYPLQLLTRGSIMVPYFFKGEVKHTRDTNWKSNSISFNFLRKHMLKNGVNLPEIGVMFLSGAHTDEDCETVVAAFKQSIYELL